MRIRTTTRDREHLVYLSAPEAAGVRHRSPRARAPSKADKGKAPASIRRSKVSTVTQRTSRLKITEPEPETVADDAVIPPGLRFHTWCSSTSSSSQVISLAKMPGRIGCSRPALSVAISPSRRWWRSTQSPPLLTRKMAHRFIDLLVKAPSTTRYNYRQKVERVLIDVREIASKTYKGQQLDLKSLVTNLPRLRVLDFAHDLDLPPSAASTSSLKWRYPDVLFEAMGATVDAAGPVLNGSTALDTLDDPFIKRGESASSQQISITKLTGWRWNRRLMGPNLNLDGIRQLHLTPTFAGLRRIGFLNYQVPSVAFEEARQRLDRAG